VWDACMHVCATRAARQHGEPSVTLAFGRPLFVNASSLVLTACVVQVKRMRAATGGTLVGLVAETLEGLPLIQAFRHEPAFEKV
jgi:hypothetical protein